MFDWRVRQDTVPKIEDMGPVFKSMQDVADSIFQHITPRNQCKRVKIALYRQSLGQFAVRPMRIDGFIKAQGINASSLGISRKLAASTFRKTDDHSIGIAGL